MTLSTLDEERTEVWSSILDEMPEAAADESRAEACRYLMCHLIESARRGGSRAAARVDHELMVEGF